MGFMFFFLHLNAVVVLFKSSQGLKKALTKNRQKRRKEK